MSLSFASGAYYSPGGTQFKVLILHKPLENFNLMNARRILELLRTAAKGVPDNYQ